MTTYYITCSSEILGGTPVITGTRIPMDRISALIKHGYTEENIQKEFSHVSPVKLRGAMYELSQLGLQRLEEIAPSEPLQTAA